LCDILSLIEELSWERDYIHTALNQLTQVKDGRLPVLLGLLGRGRKECHARKRMAFNTLMCAAMDSLTSNSLSSESSELSPEAVVQSFCVEFLDDFKERAFASAFLEPTIMYFSSTHELVAEGDVDVHGSNVYLALIEATIGILIPRMPLWVSWSYLLL
jgi:hypothetical protein